MDEHQKELLKNLPKIDEMMLRIEKRETLAGFPREIVREARRTVAEELLARIGREMKNSLTSLLFSVRGQATALNNTCHASTGLGPICAPRRVTYTGAWR